MVKTAVVQLCSGTVISKKLATIDAMLEPLLK